jgi:hypothetical protein
MNKILQSLFLLVFLYTFTTSAGASQEFLDKMALLESSSTEKHQNYQVKNTLGYLGKYQFSKRTLRGLGFTALEIKEFLKFPELQESAMRILVEHNRSILFDSYKLNRYLGKKIRGILITEEGLLAAAHLVGPNAVKLFVRSGGKYISKDGYNTPITRYLKVFQSLKKAVPSSKKLHTWRSLYDFRLRNYRSAYCADHSNDPFRFVVISEISNQTAKTEDLAFNFQHPKDNIYDLVKGEQNHHRLIAKAQTTFDPPFKKETNGLQDYLDDLLTL